MHVHLPKPMHGWRAFLGEVGIIVVGVGIALAAEQVVEAVHWHHVVDAEGQALDEEVVDNKGALQVRVLMQPCIDRRIAELGEIFRRHDAGAPLELRGPIGRPTVFTGSETTLHMATADQSVSHMELKRKKAIFAAYGAYDTFARIAEEERSSWRTLQALDHPSSLDANDWRELRKAYDAVVDNNTSMKANLRTAMPGQWLTPFIRFPQQNEKVLERELMTLPYVQKLCRPVLQEPVAHLR